MFKVLGILFIIILTGAGSIIYGCSCMHSAPCQSYGNADVVFTGKVIGSKFQISEKEYDRGILDSSEDPLVEREVVYDVGEIQFEIIDGFKSATKGSTITINSTTGGGDCGAWFKRGEIYVIFASKEGSSARTGISSLTYGGNSEIERKPDPERLWTSICSGNRPIKDAEHELAYLKTYQVQGLADKLLAPFLSR